MNTKNNLFKTLVIVLSPSRFGLVLGEVSGSSPGHTNNFKNGTYCFSACAGYNENEGNALAMKRHSLYLIE